MVYMELRGWNDCWHRLYNHHLYGLSDTRTAYTDPNNVQDRLKIWLIIGKNIKYDTNVGWKYIKYNADIIYNKNRINYYINERELNKFQKNFKNDNPILLKYAARPTFQNLALRLTHESVDIYIEIVKNYIPKQHFDILMIMIWWDCITILSSIS